MQQLMDVYRVESLQRIRLADQHKKAEQLVQANRPPNQLLLRAGQLLVQAGEQLQKQAHKPVPTLQ